MSTTFNTRIKQKIDTYANWHSNNPVLLAGEIGIVVVPAGAGQVEQEPAYLIKVGDGTKTFDQLPYVSAIAADVYDWAKSATKPVYDATEIQNLDDYIHGKVQDTNTTYKIEQDTTDGHKFKLFKHELTDASGTWTQVGSDIVIPDSDTTYSFETAGTDDAYITVTPSEGSAVNAKVKGLGTAAFTSAEAYDVAGAAVSVQGNTTKTVKDVADEAAAAQSAADAAQEAADAAQEDATQALADAAAAQATADAKIASVTAADASVIVGGTSTAKTVKVQISDDTDNALSLEDDGLKVVVPEGTDYSVSLTTATTPTEGYLKTYVLSQLGEEIGKIDIPKDYVVKSASVVKNPTGQPAGTYIEFVIGVKTESGSAEQKIYINVKDLCDVYTVEQGAAKVQLAISDENVISATIVAGSIGTTDLADGAVVTGKLATGAVTTAKIADDAVTTDKLADDIVEDLELAESALQPEDITVGATNGTISVDGTDVAVKGLGSAAYTDSTAYDAAGAAATAKDEAIAAVVGTASDTSAADTIKGAKKYADEQIGEITPEDIGAEPEGTAQGLIDELDSFANIASVNSDDIVTIKTTVQQTDGLIGNGSSNISLAKVAKTGMMDDLGQIDTIIFDCGSSEITPAQLNAFFTKDGEPVVTSDGKNFTVR